jgi:hypothetical protein
MAADIHVLPVGDEWMVRREGTEEPLSTHSTQAEATSAGRAQAKTDEAELVIHGQDGQIRGKDSEGNDPRDVPG